MIAGLMVGIFSISSYAATMGKTEVNVGKILNQKIFRLQREHLSKSAKTIKARWNIYDTKKVSRRQVTVFVLWGKPTLVETTCRAIVNNGLLYVAQSCYEPVRESNQYQQWLGSKLVLENAEYELDQPTDEQSGFVIFELPTLPSETQSKLDCRA